VQWNVTVKPEVSPLHRLSREAVYSLSRVRNKVRRGLRQVEDALAGNGRNGNAE
jgi:hypothetical protein